MTSRAAWQASCLLILVVKFFQQALRLKYESPLDLLQLALGIVLVAGALFLGHRRTLGEHPRE
jgi:uncharacterized membrane protein YqhA